MGKINQNKNGRLKAPKRKKDKQKMKQRKKVYWKKQRVTEYFEHCSSLGWIKVDKWDGWKWKHGTFEYHEQIASKEQFENRVDGLIRW